MNVIIFDANENGANNFKLRMQFIKINGINVINIYISNEILFGVYSSATAFTFTATNKT